MTCPDRRRFSILIAAITPLALAMALLFSTVQAQEGSAPDKPTGLSATASHDRVVLTWDDPDDNAITGYVILRRVRENDVGGEFSELVPDTGTAATTYTDDTVKAGTTYTYRIKAINEHGVSERSRWFHIDTRAAPKPPDKPRGLSATASHDRVVLTWDDPRDSTITGYVILRRNRDTDPSGQFTTLVEDTGTAATTYTDATVEPETSYTYRVKAINADGTSERSRWVHIDTLPAPTATLVDNEEDHRAAPGVTRADGDEEACPGGGFSPTPTPVDVTAVPIVVASTTADYFVLRVRHDVDGAEVEVPVAVTRGAAGTTTLAENLAALPKERYRVEKYLVADPADVDGDCLDDITELGNPVGMNPVNPAPAIPFSDGAVAMPDRHTFEALENHEVVKFVLFDMDTGRPGVYFLNSETHGAHHTFLEAVGLEGSDVMAGAFMFNPDIPAPDGSLGLYFYSVPRVDYPFGVAAHIHTVLAASMPLLENNLALHIANQLLLRLQSDLPLYQHSRISLLFDEDILPESGFIPLNAAEGYGRLRVLDPDDRPHPRDIVIYEALPNELPRVAGIISTVPQTPLSHVNLRAVQDGIPNAFIRGALDNDQIAPLVGGYVRYQVTENGWTLRAATPAEVNDYYASHRPDQVQVPQRDLSIKAIKPLSDIGFDDWQAFGVKAANVAVLRTLGFPDGTVPDGFAVPFYFYDEFMKAHDFYSRIEAMLAAPDFQTDFEVQDDMLDDLRDDIKDAETPAWIIEALTAWHATFLEGTSLRYRSSTNNEDLPGFNGAGLYDSKTQHPDETEEDGIDKSLKQVFASLWTFRAFTEREFHRIDHLAAAMGVLVHPNYSDELANGVAVSFDPIHGNDGTYYVNTQIGEDLVTNPEAHSVPEEILLHEGNYVTVLALSNQAPPGQLLTSRAQQRQLRRHLEVIHDHFEGLYAPQANRSPWKSSSRSPARTSWRSSRPAPGYSPTTPAPVMVPMAPTAPTTPRGRKGHPTGSRSPARTSWRSSRPAPGYSPTTPAPVMVPMAPTAPTTPRGRKAAATRAIQSTCGTRTRGAIGTSRPRHPTGSAGRHWRHLGGHRHRTARQPRAHPAP